MADVERAASFWKSALGYVSDPGNVAFLRSKGDGPRLHLDETDTMHLDLWADDQDEQRAEVERLVALGAERVEWDYPEGADFVVLADPEGNLFCVIDASR